MMRRIAATPKNPHDGADDPVIRVERLEEPEQDARIDEDEHQSWSV